MAYKFQLGAATLSGSLTQEGTVEIHSDAGAIVGVFDNAGFLSGAAGVEGATFTADGAVTAGSLVVGAADLNATDLLKIDAITNGAGAANKALVLDANATIASGLVALTASSGIKAGEVAATGHLTAPALIATGAGIISGSGQGSFENLSLGGGTSTISNTGVAAFGGTVTAVGSFIIGSADLNEADMEKLDGITNGAGAANKALVLNAASSIASGLASITASADVKAAVLEATSEVRIGNARLSEAELEMIDGITAGTAAASKAVVLDANKDIATLRNVTLNGALNTATLSASGDAGAERLYAGGPNFAGAAFKVDAVGVMNVADILGTSFSGSSFVSASHLSINNNNAKILANGDATFAATTMAAATATTLSASSTLKVAGTVQFDGVADTAFTAADSLYFLDADGLMKRDSFSDVMEIAAGVVGTTGIENTSGVLSLSIHGLGAETIATGDKLAFSDSGDNGLHHETVDDLFSIGPALVAAASIDVSADHFLFLDGGASGVAKKESIVDLVAGMAGAGLAASGGQLSVQGNTVTAATDTVVLSEGYNYFTGSATAVCSLPNASVGDVVTVKAADTAVGNSVTISRSGSQTIDGATSLVLESPFAAVTLVYVANNDWRIV